MDGIVDGEHLVKSVHKEPETERERVHYFDEAEARMLGVVLADHPCFQEKAARVAAFPLDERRIRAREEALSYVPYEGQRRDVVVRLLLDAATVDERMPSGLKDAATVDERGPGLIAAFRRDVLANSLSRAVWAEADREGQDAERCRHRWARLQEGAERLARFGASTCVECGSKLSDRYETGGGPRPRRARRTHCSPCERAIQKKVRESHGDAIRDALDAASGHRRKRRAARRQTTRRGYGPLPGDRDLPSPSEERMAQLREMRANREHDALVQWDYQKWLEEGDGSNLES